MGSPVELTGFHQQPKHVPIKLMRDSKLPLGTSVCVRERRVCSAGRAAARPVTQTGANNTSVNINKLSQKNPNGETTMKTKTQM